MTERPKISNEVLAYIYTSLQQELLRQIQTKGYDGFVSSLETRGAVGEELDEFNAAVHAHDQDGAKRELMDVMIAAFWGLASQQAGGWSW